MRLTAALNIQEKVPLLPRGVSEAISLAERVKDFRASGRDAAMRTGCARDGESVRSVRNREKTREPRSGEGAGRKRGSRVAAQQPLSVARREEMKLPGCRANEKATAPGSRPEPNRPVRAPNASTYSLKSYKNLFYYLLLSIIVLTI